MVSPQTIARTVMRLRPGQVALRPFARLSNAVAPWVAGSFTVADGAIDRVADWASVTGAWSRSASIAEAERGLAGAWRYVGRTVTNDRPPMGGPFPSRLWRYELQYRRWIEGLAHLAASGTLSRERLDAWWDVAEAESGREAWEPYVLARRLWSEATAAGIVREERAIPRLAREAAALFLMPEIHIGANHLLADRAAVAAISLLLAPDGPDASQRLLEYMEELERQVDRDGLHEERSPGYHLIALHDLKRVIAAAAIARKDREKALLGSYETRMAGSLSQLMHPDGSLPSFHDSVPEVEPSASELGVEAECKGGAYDLPESGLRGWRGKIYGHQVHIVADYGAPRPSHQPGHQHAAPFAFELWWDGPVITGRGVSTYEANDERLRERGASSHSCITLDGRDPAEIWSAFRMGRGYKVTNRRTGSEGGHWVVAGTHDGFVGRIHTRSIALDPGAAVLDVDDHVDGRGDAELKLHLPIAAPWSPERVGDHELILRRDRNRISLRFSGFDTVEVSPTIMYRKFGEPGEGSLVIATRGRSLPSQSAVRISLATDS